MNPHTSPPLRIGLIGIGLEAYWEQFEGLKGRFEGYVRVVAGRLERPGVEVVNLGLIDSPARAMEAGHPFRREDVDVMLLYVTTYALSSTVLPVVQRAKVPVIILNLQPAAAIDYEAFNAMGDRARMTGEWVAYCSACPVPEIANVLRRSGIPFHQVTGMLEDDPICWEEIRAWIDAARVASDTTTASARTPYAIDWILVPDEWRINAKNVVRSPASDHWPVFMEVQVGF